jgi:hypothetical protein
MELTYKQTEHLLHRFPKLELSYETFAHKKVSSNYDICISIPNGKKQMMWFTYYGDADVCYLMDMNKENKITKIIKTDIQYNNKLAYETILYGTLCPIDDRNSFVIEDIYYFCGLPVKHLLFGEKLTYLHTMMSSYIPNNSSIVIALPYICSVVGDNKLLDSLPFYESVVTKTAYISHHIQFRSSNTISPYLNHTYKKKQEQVVSSEPDIILFPRNDLDYYAQTKMNSAVFKVTADIQNDIYHLFAYDPAINHFTYVNIAYIGTRKLSVYMNDLFRNIRENKNVDYGEESEDEDTFQNVSADKYVDLKKEYKMFCIFHKKFKKWVPVNTVDINSKCVCINDLLAGTQPTAYRSQTTAYRSQTTAYRSQTNSYQSKPQNSYQSKPHQTNSYQTNPYQTNNYRTQTNSYQPNQNNNPYQTNNYRTQTNQPNQNNNSYQPQKSAYKPYSNKPNNYYGKNTKK